MVGVKSQSSNKKTPKIFEKTPENEKLLLKKL